MVESVEKESEKFIDIVMECTNDVLGREEMKVDGGMKWVARWPKSEVLLRNGFREEIWLPITDSGHRVWV